MGPMLQENLCGLSAVNTQGIGTHWELKEMIGIHRITGWFGLEGTNACRRVPLQEAGQAWPLYDFGCHSTCGRGGCTQLSCTGTRRDAVMLAKLDWHKCNIQLVPSSWCTLGIHTHTILVVEIESQPLMGTVSSSITLFQWVIITKENSTVLKAQPSD